MTKENIAEDTLGEVLLKAREKSGRDLESIAAELCIQKHHLESIEKNEYSNMGGVTYIKGYIRSYARSLGLDEETLVELFVEQNPQEEVGVGKRDIVESRPKSQMSLLVGTAVIAAVLIAFLTHWMGQSSESDDDSQMLSASEALQQKEAVDPISDAVAKESQQIQQSDTDDKVEWTKEVAAGLDKEDSPEMTPAEAASLTPISQQAAEKEKINAKTASSMASSDIPKSQDENIQTDVSSQAQPDSQKNNKYDEDTVKTVEMDPIDAPKKQTKIIGSGDDVIEMRLSDDSWVDIQDSAGNALVQGLFKAGATRIIRGSAPFQVFLGNAPGVSIQFNNEYFNTQNYVRDNNTARFALVSP